MNRLKKVFDNLDLEVATNDPNEKSDTAAGHELQEFPSPLRRRASSADYCIEGRLKGGSFCDSVGENDDDDNNNNSTNHEFPRRKANPRRGGLFPKRHSTSDCLDQRYTAGNDASIGNQNSASSFGFDFSSRVSPSPAPLDNPHEIKKLDRQNSFPDFVGALGARHLALRAAADAAKDKQRQDELCDSDHIDPDEERLHYSEDLRGSFAAVQPKEARLRRSKHLAKFKQHRSDDNLDGSAHSDQSGYDSSSSFGSVGDLILKALSSAGQDLESEMSATTATNLSNARARRRTTKAAHKHRNRRQYRGSYTEDLIQPKTGFGQNLPCIAPTPQGFGGRRGSDYCGEEEIIYRRRSSASYASRRRSSRSAISNKGNDDSDDDDDAKPKAKNIKNSSTSKPKSKIPHKASSKSKSQRRASRGSQVDKKNPSHMTSNDSGRSSGSCRSEALDGDLSRRISAADQSCDSFKTLASIEAAMKRNRFAPV